MRSSLERTTGPKTIASSYSPYPPTSYVRLFLLLLLLLLLLLPPPSFLPPSRAPPPSSSFLLSSPSLLWSMFFLPPRPPSSRSPHSIVCLHPPSVANRAPEEARRRLASQLTEHREKLRSWDLEEKSEALGRSEHAARVRRFAQSVQTSVAQASLAVTPRARTRRPSKVRDGGRIVFQPAPPGGPQVFRLRGSKAKPVLPCRQGCLCYVCESKRRIRHRRRKQ